MKEPGVNSFAMCINRNVIVRVTTLTVVSLITGCVSLTKQVTPEVAKLITHGQERSTVNQHLGQPNWSHSGRNGNSVDTHVQSELVFSASSASASARDLKVRTLSIRYDADGKVNETLFYESRSPAVLYSRSAYAGPDITSEQAARVKIGSTTQKDCEALFQKAMIVTLHPVAGRELHWYHVEVGTSFTSPDQTRGLHVLVDEQGVVRDVYFSNRSSDRK